MRILQELKIAFHQNVQIGRYNVDFLCGEVVLECFGDFWHCNPAIWQPEDYNASLKMTAAEKWQRDAARAKRLEAQGFRVHVLWESEIVNEPARVRKTISALLDGNHVQAT